MTKDEAIRILEQICPKRPQKLWSVKRKEAVKMAIEALTHFNSTSNSIKNELNELSCSEKPNRSDTIYRQKAMEAWKAYINYLPSAQLKPKTADSGSVDSEQPEIKTDRTIGGMIYRQDAIDAAIEAVDEWDGGYNLTRADMIADAINNAVPSAQSEPVNSLTKSDMISKQKVRYKLTALVNEIEEIFANIRKREVDDSVCGLCEYDGAYIGQSGDWCNECPGFEKDNCFKLNDKYRAEWESIDE